MDTNGFGPDERLIKLTEKLVNHFGVADSHYRLEIDYAEAGFPQGFVGARDEQFKREVEKLTPSDFIAQEPEPPRDEDNVVEDRWEARVWGVPITFMHHRLAYPIEIATFNSSTLRAEAKRLGVTHMRKLTGGYADGHEGESDWYVGFYALFNPQGWEFRVATTNGDPVWEEDDEEVFSELAQSCGISF